MVHDGGRRISTSGAQACGVGIGSVISIHSREVSHRRLRCTVGQILSATSPLSLAPGKIITLAGEGGGREIGGGGQQKPFSLTAVR